MFRETYIRSLVKKKANKDTQCGETDSVCWDEMSLEWRGLHLDIALRWAKVANGAFLTYSVGSK